MKAWLIPTICLSKMNIFAIKVSKNGPNNADMNSSVSIWPERK